LASGVLSQKAYPKKRGWNGRKEAQEAQKQKGFPLFSMAGLFI
jgi:hypothetical protein